MYNFTRFPGGLVVNAAISGLQSGVLYHFRLVTVTSQGTFYSADQTFATPGAPLVITGSFVAAGKTGFSCDGLLNPLGDTTLYWFEYGDEPGNYEHQTAPVIAWYREHDQHIAEIDALGTFDEVKARALQAVGKG